MSERLGGIKGCGDKTSSWHLNGFPDGSNIGSTVVVVVDSHIQRIVLATEETTVTQQVSHIRLSNANPSCGHKEVRRSTGYIMVTTRYTVDPM